MTSTIMVFSHPNHEIAVLGTIFRLRPHIIYLTDGGGQIRVNQTKRALQDYQPTSVHYLNHSEQSLYDALLTCDSDFYRALATEVSSLLEKMGGDTVYCDAVEFYNPVHDIALPVVRAAVGINDFQICEIPLIYQKKTSGEAFKLQHVPESLSDQSICEKLTPGEFHRKIGTIKSDIYTMLFAQLGSIITEALASPAACEYFLKGRSSLPSPAVEQVLRYEERGKALKSTGAVRDVITFAGHYVPIFEALCEPSSTWRTAQGQQYAFS